MNKTKIKIMELLGDFVDKEVRIGCIIEKKVHHSGQIMTYYDVYGRCDYTERKENSDVVIGQYGHHTFLRWCIKNHMVFDFIYNKTGDLRVANHTEDKDKLPVCYEIKLNLTKSLMEYTEEQDKKLLDFMQKVGEGQSKN